VVNPRRWDARETLRDLMHEKLAGPITAIQGCFRYIRPGERIVIFGVPPRKCFDKDSSLR